MEKLLDLIHAGQMSDWTQRCQDAFYELYGSAGGRYPERARQSVALRAPAGAGVPFAALIDPSNPDSGAYGGMSFVIFPMADRPALLGMVIGTQGLSPVSYTHLDVYKRQTTRSPSPFLVRNTGSPVCLHSSDISL